MTTEAIDPASAAYKLNQLIAESSTLQAELTHVTAELKEMTRQRDALQPGEGRVVVELPEPDVAEIYVYHWVPAGIRVSAFQAGHWRVAMDFGCYAIDWPPGVARDVFAAGLAACDRAEQMAHEAAAEVNHG